MGLFDSFLTQSAGGELSTERLLVPPNVYNNCYIREVKIQEGTVKQGERVGQPWAKLLVVWVLDHPELRDELGRAEVVLTQGIMLDLTPEGHIDNGKGRNVRLGKLKKALGLNTPEATFADFVQKRGVLQVRHDSYNGEPVEDIVSVAAA